MLKKCRYCDKEYNLNYLTDLKYIDCCSEDCILQYFIITGCGFNINCLDEQVIIKLGESKKLKSCKYLVDQHKRKLRE